MERTGEEKKNKTSPSYSGRIKKDRKRKERVQESKKDTGLNEGRLSLVWVRKFQEEKLGEVKKASKKKRKKKVKRKSTKKPLTRKTSAAEEKEIKGHCKHTDEKGLRGRKNRSELFGRRECGKGKRMRKKGFNKNHNGKRMEEFQ